MTASSSTTPTPDPLALHPDGSALDPAAFRARLLGDPAAVADLAAADPAALAVLRSGADGPLQELLKAVYAVRGGGGVGGCARVRARARERDRQLQPEVASSLFPALLNLAPSSPPPLADRRRSAGPSTRPAPCRSGPSTPSARPRPCHGKQKG